MVGRRGAPTDAQWQAALSARLSTCVPQLVPGSACVHRILPLADEVWLVQLADGGRVVAKHQFYGLLTRGQPHDQLDVEYRVLRHLRGAGCPVPMAFGVDPDSQTILLEYAGPRTLAEALRGPHSAAERRRWLDRLLTGLYRIDAELTADTVWQKRVAPGASRQELLSSWRAVEAAAVEGLRALPGASSAASAALVTELVARLGARPPSLGACDFQPANVVLDALGERLTFIEFAKLGWDWTERRAVQYTTIGDRSGPMGLLDPHGVAACAALDAAARVALDGHHLIFHLLLARRATGASAPLVRALVAPLSGDPLTGRLRQAIGHETGGLPP